MIKKIVLLSLMLIASLGCIAQDKFYVVPEVNTKFDFGNSYNVYDFTIDFQYYRMNDNGYWSRFSCGIGARIINDNFGPIIEASYGIGVNLGGFYWAMNFRPTVRCVGNGHQVYGDEIVFGIIPSLCVGYDYPITDYTVIFIETGLYKEFDIIYTRDDLNVNSFGIYFSVGFKFI